MNTPSTSLIATLADLKATREYVNIRYQNSPWAMGPQYRDRLARIDQQIRDIEDQLDA